MITINCDFSVNFLRHIFLISFSPKIEKIPFGEEGFFSYFLYIKTSWGKIYDINITNNCENFVTLLGKILSF